MEDSRKTKAQLIEELDALRRRVVELEKYDTDRKQERQASESTLRSFIESATEGIILCDSGLNVLDINEAALNISVVRTTREAVVGKNMLKVAPGLLGTDGIYRHQGQIFSFYLLA